MNKMREFYQEEAVPSLTKDFGFTSVMQVPRIDKIVVNIGLGEAKDNPKLSKLLLVILLPLLGNALC